LRQQYVLNLRDAILNHREHKEHRDSRHGINRSVTAASKKKTSEDTIRHSGIRSRRRIMDVQLEVDSQVHQNRQTSFARTPFVRASI
jgi:hypothetical protein